MLLSFDVAKTGFVHNHLLLLLHGPHTEQLHASFCCRPQLRHGCTAHPLQSQTHSSISAPLPLTYIHQVDKMAAIPAQCNPATRTGEVTFCRLWPHCEVPPLSAQCLVTMVIAHAHNITLTIIHVGIEQQLQVFCPGLLNGSGVTLLAVPFQIQIVHVQLKWVQSK